MQLEIGKLLRRRYRRKSAQGSTHPESSDPQPAFASHTL
jgi:hypothetical protein